MRDDDADDALGRYRARIACAQIVVLAKFCAARMDLFDVLDGPPGDGVAECLTLVDLCCCRRACRSLRAWAEEAIELRRGVTRADVDAGVHTRAPHWLVKKSSQGRIALAVGTYMLGDMDDPTQVYNVRPPTYDEDDNDEAAAWLHWETDWRPGYGPLVR